MVVSIHCGSRGLGHQIGTEFLREMVMGARDAGIELPDRELACAPLNSALGRRYLGAMRAAINCALANRQILTQLTREAFREVLPGVRLPLLYDVSHNTCKEETHVVDGVARRLHVHRKGATRAFGPHHADLPPEFRESGQPVLIGGSMGTGSYILAGLAGGMEKAFGSACHGAGRAMSRNAALKRWHGPGGGGRTGGAGHPDSQPVAARRGGGGAGCLQGRERGGGGGGPRPDWRAPWRAWNR